MEPMTSPKPAGGAGCLLESPSQEVSLVLEPPAQKNLEFKTRRPITGLKSRVGVIKEHHSPPHPRDTRAHPSGVQSISIMMSSAMTIPASAARVVSPARRDVRALRSRAGSRATFSKQARVNNEIVARAFSVVEPATKVSFPKTFNPHGGDTMQCIGAGVREKKIAIINVKVYGVAMYVDAAKCKEELANGGSLLTGSFDKALLVQLVRDVDGKTFWEALDEAVGPRIRRIATDMATAEDEDGNFMASVAEAAEVAEEKAMDECEEIKGLFQGRKLRKDDKVLIWWSPNKGKFEIGVVGGMPLELTSQQLAQAVFDVYCGDDPVSPSAYQSFVAGAAAL